MQQSVFDALPLTAVHILQPTAQPQNGLNTFLQSSIPTFMVANDEGVRSNIETDRDLLPDWEFQEVRDYFVKLTAELIMKCDSRNSRQNDNELIMQLLPQISQLVPASQPNGAWHWGWWRRAALLELTHNQFSTFLGWELWSKSYHGCVNCLVCNPTQRSAN